MTRMQRCHSGFRVTTQHVIVPLSRLLTTRDQPNNSRSLYQMHLSAVILGCVLLARAEPPVTSYSVGGENNGYEYNSNIINGAYMAAKEGHRENTDFYTGGSNGHSLSASRSQGNLEESSYNAFSPTAHSTGYSEYSGSRDNHGTSPYLMNTPSQSTFETYAANTGNGDSTFETYTQGTDQASSDFNQFPGKSKNSVYMRLADSLSGASSTAGYSELGAEGSSFKEYSGDSFRGHAPHRGYMDGDHLFNREPANPFNGPSSDYSYGKQKEGMFAVVGGNKFMNDVYPFHSETRYVRGNHGSMGSPVYMSSSASSPFTRGSTSPYASGKYSKYNKYTSEYTPNGGLNYLSKEQDIDYLFGNYGKGSGKLVPFKDNRPSSYSSQPYIPGPSYITKMVGNYKSKPSYMSYTSGSPVGYSSMPNVHSSFGSSSYADNPLLRRYRSSSYVPGHGSVYPGYY